MIKYKLFGIGIIAFVVLLWYAFWKFLVEPAFTIPIWTAGGIILVVFDIIMGFGLLIISMIGFVAAAFFITDKTPKFKKKKVENERI